MNPSPTPLDALKRKASEAWDARKESFSAFYYGAPATTQARLAFEEGYLSALSETGEPTGSYDRGWNEAIDRAALIADDVWRDENSLAGSKAASRVAQRIRDLKVPA